MKLIDLLVKELPKSGGWPEGVDNITQYKHGELCFNNEDDSCAESNTNIVIEPHEDGDNGDDTFNKWAFGLKVTRTQYESALAKNDGWIEWGGGECPVHESANVDIKLEDGSEKSDVPASAFIWQHDDDVTNIIAYRLHKPQQEEQQDASEEDLNDCIGQAPATLWNGRWLPSAGCECEYQYKVHGSEWCRFECIAVDGKAVFGWSNNTPVALQSNTHNFRPLRTEAENVRESACHEIASMIGRGTFFEDAERIYDAISSGEIKVYSKESK